MKKKILALVLAFSILVSLLPASMITVSAEEVDGGSCGDNLAWTLDANGTLTITGTGDMYDWYYEESPWYSYREDIYKVIIENGVTRIGNYAFCECIELESVTIPGSVVDIGESSFEYCTGLTDIGIPDGVVYIGNGAFIGCSKLTSITIPDSVASIGIYAFNECTGLTEIIVDSNNSAYASEDGVLFNKNKTELLRYPAGKAESTYEIPDGVLNIGDNAFINCSGLTEMVISDSVISIGGYAFNQSGLTHITISDSVTDISEYAFMNCHELTEITVDSNNPAYTSEDGVLFDIDKTKLIRYPSAKTETAYEIPSSVNVIGETAFVACTELTSITIPDGVTKLYSWSFMGCKSLTNVTIPASVTTIESWAFLECKNLTDVYYGGTKEEWNKLISPWGSSNENLTNATIHYAETVDFTADANIAYGKNLTHIGGHYYSSGLAPSVGRQFATDGNLDTYHSGYGRVNGVTTGVVFSIDLGREYNLEDITMFLNNTNRSYKVYKGTTVDENNLLLTSTAGETTTIVNDKEVYKSAGTFPADTTAQHLTICSPSGYGFTYCEIYITGTEVEDEVAGGTCGENLTWTLASNGTLTISGTGRMPYWDVAAYVPWDSYKNKIYNVIIEDGVTSIGDYAFAYCSNLTDITIPNSITRIGEYAFGGSSSLVNINIPSSVTSIGDVAFDCSGLTEINVDSNNTVYTSVDGVLFDKSVTKLICYPRGKTETTYEIPDSVTSIGNWAFNFCNQLTSITIPDGVTDINGYAFSYCSELTSITIPDSVTDIGECAFGECENLADVYYGGTKYDWNSISIGAYNECLTDATIHYASVIVLGDANGDGEIDFADAILVLKHDAGVSTLTGDNLTAADTNGDGEVDFVDAIQILKYDCGLISSFN